MSAAGLRMSDVRWLLLTHIHLDHAGAAGTLTRLQPNLRIYVHPRGAPHLVDPSKLLASANRIYGDRLGELFGAVLPVASDQVCTVADREVVKLGNRAIRVEHAPGHAVHHVVYLDEHTGTAFAGDTAGERFRPSTYVLPVTPPPDIDLVAWHGTLRRLRAWQSQSLFLTHFGSFPDSARHLDELEARLNLWSGRVRASLEETSTDEERAQAFVDQASDELRLEIATDLLPKYLSGGIRDSWYGLARYWRRPISR
jgi:glyoxylase-like metal-dependent hydrolase (beta-lactamase superfamily II)